MSKERILWADDEIDLLKPHILFLQNKGYDVETVTNGRDAIDTLSNQIFNLIILDENMPGISGLEALQRIKMLQPNVPVIMITKKGAYMSESSRRQPVLPARWPAIVMLLSRRKRLSMCINLPET